MPALRDGRCPRRSCWFTPAPRRAHRHHPPRTTNRAVRRQIPRAAAGKARRAGVRRQRHSARIRAPAYTPARRLCLVDHTHVTRRGSRDCGGATETTPRKQALIVWGGWAGHLNPRPARTPALDRSRTTSRVRLRPALQAFCRPGAQLNHLYLDRPGIYTFTAKIEKAEAIANLSDAVRAGVGMAGFHGRHVRCVSASRSTTSSSRRRPVGRASGRHHRLPRQRGATRTTSVMHGLDDFDYRPSSTTCTSTLIERRCWPPPPSLAPARAPGIDGVVTPVVWKRRHGSGRVSLLQRAQPRCRRVRRRRCAPITAPQRGLLWPGAVTRAPALPGIDRPSNCRIDADCGSAQQIGDLPTPVTEVRRWRQMPPVPMVRCSRAVPTPLAAARAGRARPCIGVAKFRLDHRRACLSTGGGRWSVPNRCGWCGLTTFMHTLAAPACRARSGSQLAAYGPLTLGSDQNSGSCPG